MLHNTPSLKLDSPAKDFGYLKSVIPGYPFLGVSDFAIGLNLACESSARAPITLPVPFDSDGDAVSPRT
uniref:Uncharacterized protein n=1 Tax=Candidatus Kentrum sp. TUN TaxID=2126343 RepID=A0A450ZUY3_9GAMM|nr:MAG: hypothetical protein BECKTUN1418D_GA0071000_101110 [Candidatus Kentron sp. TUN]VFK54578.1 MAG: hypothetical protein BECKTUN1418F_GA0071002_10476 [Candidatus Kentron sp. TUN]VFK57604.1 MAG: hypothetical protein BECKTUN1418E_GA0071001_10466 [Candidatus Kentron sp. TUN]